MRLEQAVFDDLTCLCTSPGYIHALAALCLRDNTILWTDEITTEHTSHQFSESRLTRTEMTTLIGLMMRAPIDLSVPAPNVFSDYVTRTAELLEEMHLVLALPMKDVMSSALEKQLTVNPFARGDILREAIFYGPESAYPFQYRDLAPRKYGQDSSWLLTNKNIDLRITRDICLGIAALIDDQMSKIVHTFRTKPLAEWPVLSGFTFSCDELATRIDQPVSRVRPVIDAFAMAEGRRNVDFKSLRHFNAAYAYPLIRVGPAGFAMLHPYGIAEALYETPFYWMCEDDAYAPEASRHRGEFTEQFSAERLKRAFGADRVFENVEIQQSKRVILGEIDVLVIFGDRTIVLQAKSKKLTQIARTGDDYQLRMDFQQAVQESVDQAFDCSQLLGNPSVTLRCRDGRVVSLPKSPRTIFPLSVVADHYPALAFQARQFLKARTNEQIHPPLVVDVFALDVMTEMLDSPLRFLSYLTLRSRFGDNLMASQELTLLSYHLKRNLWVEDDVGLSHLTDDVAADLDVAMMVRRDGIPGKRTPDGILTRFEGTPFASIITQIEDEPEAVTIDLGLSLLELGENSVKEMNRRIDQVLERTAIDGELHDVTLFNSMASFGLTIHCSMLYDRTTAITLEGHCEMRKYAQRADRWFGIALRPDGLIRLVTSLAEPWKVDQEMEKMLLKLPPSPQADHRYSSGKVGRNQPCPCGSGKKYKRCCINVRRVRDS